MARPRRILCGTQSRSEREETSISGDDVVLRGQCRRGGGNGAGTLQLSSGSAHMNEDEAQFLSLMIRERLETMVPQQPVDATPIVRDIRARPPFDDVSEDEVRAALLRHCEALGRVCR